MLEIIDPTSCAGGKANKGQDDVLQSICDDENDSEISAYFGLMVTIDALNHSGRIIEYSYSAMSLKNFITKIEEIIFNLQQEALNKVTLKYPAILELVQQMFMAAAGQDERVDLSTLNLLYRALPCLLKDKVQWQKDTSLLFIAQMGKQERLKVDKREDLSDAIRKFMQFMGVVYHAEKNKLILKGKDTRMLSEIKNYLVDFKRKW